MCLVRPRFCSVCVVSFPNILFPSQWQISGRKHIITGRDESSLKFLVAERIFPPWMSAYSPLYPTQHPGLSPPIPHEHSLCSPNKDIRLAPMGLSHHAKRKSALCSCCEADGQAVWTPLPCLIFQFYKLWRGHLWDGIIDPDPATSTICKCYPL